MRPMSASEDDAISEAMATINAGPDGSISVEVTGDIDVSAGEEDGMLLGDEPGGELPLDGEMDDIDGGLDDEMGAIDGEDDGLPSDGIGDETDPMGGGDDEMSPVDSIAPEGPESGPPEMGDDDMPNFEEEKPQVFEDKDVTDPSNSKYTKHVTDNKRKVEDPKKPGDAGDTLEGFGSDPKEDDGSGTNPPTAKK